jgi:hypothetical protein
VGGEAGIGKTALVRAFTESHDLTGVTAWGSCDGLFTPRPLGPLFDEAREVLTMELTSTATHFSLLSALAGSPSLEWSDLVHRSHVEESVASRYVRILEDLHIVQSANPVFAPPNARRRRYRVADPFIRFWFRFVFPYQADLTAGLYYRPLPPYMDPAVNGDFDVVGTVSAHPLGQWSTFTYGVLADAFSIAGGSFSVTVRLDSIEILGVENVNGEPVPVHARCSASGHNYGW